MKTIARSILGATLATLAAWPLAGAAAEPLPPPSTIPAEAFFDFAKMSDPRISPNGDALAMLVRNKVGRRQLAIIDTADLTKANIAVSYDDADIVDVHWVNDTRLVFRIFHEDKSADHQDGGGLYAVDRDGGNLRNLIRPNWDREQQTGKLVTQRALDPDYDFVRTLSDGSDDIVIEHVTHSQVFGNESRYAVDITGSIPSRMNTRSGLLHDLLDGKSPDHVHDWFVDDTGHVLGGIASENGQSTLFLHTDGAWVGSTRFPTYEATADSFEFRAMGSDGHVYVTQKNGSTGAAALYRLDLATGKPEAQPVASIRGFDFHGNIVNDQAHHRVLGVHYEADADGTAWFDAAMTDLQRKIDARLPGLVNRIDAASCGCATRVMVTSHSDRQPALYFLYDRKDDTLIPVGISRPAISARQMADTDFVRIKARDGQDLPLYVTKPHGKGPWPTVVLVHGGPFLRGWNWEWDGESQFLASRGYLVIKPEYRGSTGYGEQLFKSGFKQWGLKMQDDIADATAWGAQQGLEDPHRTCIAGASYGGYATLMGLVRYGDLYQCGVAWAAVSDISMMQDIWWSDMDEEWRHFGMPVMVGDSVKDAEQLKATSPLQQAAHIKRPLLLAHGTDDHRVPVAQANALREALEANHATLTWILYTGEGHGWYQPETRASFYRSMEKFLDANIGPGANLSQH